MSEVERIERERNILNKKCHECKYTHREERTANKEEKAEVEGNL